VNRKAFGILLVATGVFVVLAIVGQGPSGSGPIAGDSAGALLFPALTDDLESVGEIRVDAAGRERVVTLERSADDWVVAELDGYEAERGAVNALLIALAEARIVEEKTADPAFHSRLGVEAIDDAEAGGLELTLVAADGDRYSVVLGATYGPGQRYARVASEDLSVLIDRDPDIPEDPSDWVVTEIIDIAADRVQSVEISHTDGESLAIRKAARGETNFSVEGVPVGRELQYAGVANVTGNLLQGLRLEAVRRRIDEPEEPRAVTEFRTFDGLVIGVTATAGEDDETWLAFNARFDTGQALAFATEPVGAGIAGDESGDGIDPVDAVDPGDPDAIAEAAAINARLGDWQYRIASYQLGQLTRRMDDLLRPEADE
jgi:hypothetical protein